MIPAAVRIFVCTEAIDMRQGFDRLAQLVRSKLGEDPHDTAIVRGVIALAKSLNLAVTAEGIETSEQLDELRTLGCDKGQGYYFARPMTANDCRNWILRERTEPQRLAG